jgi:hypothetical protein
MNVKKAIKKVVALGSGLTMIGATIMGATADLGAYPAPFVQDGVFNGAIVVGSAAATSDVLGAIDISASLQAAAKTGVASGAAATTTVEGGVLLEDTNNQDFNWGDYLSASSLDDGDFPALLADGVLSDDDGTDYDYDQEIVVGNETLAYSLVDNDVYSDPVMYLDLDAATNTDYILTFTLDFDSGDSVDWESLDDSESIEMFGTTWTIDNIAAAGTDNLVLYGSDVTQLVSLNTPIDVEVDETSYTLDLVGANSDASPAEVHVSVNGEVKSMSEGQTKTISGLKVYVQDVFVSTVGGESASANLFIGSKELDLGNTFSSWSSIELDDETLDGVEVYLTGSDTAVSQMGFRVTATDLENADTEEDYDWLAMGDSFVDPLFGFEVKFVEAIPAFDASSRDYAKFKSSNDDFEVTFTNHDGAETTFSPYAKHSNGANLTVGEDFVFAAQNSVAKDKLFILEEDSSSSEPKSIVFEFTGSDLSDDEANFKNTGSGETFTIGSGDSLADTGVTVTIDADDVVNLSATSKTYVYSASGAWINFTTASNEATQTVTINEDGKAVNSDEVAGDDYTVAISYDGTDEEVNIARPSSWDGGADDDKDGDYYYGVGEYGSYYVHEADDSTSLELWFPSEDADYAVYLSGPGATTSTSGGAAATSYTVNELGVGIGILDTDAAALGSTPMIVVGGPCANTVAAELMGNQADCAAGFEDGKAVIKFYEDSSAILVAGYSAMDTQGASRVLADYADWGLSGSEVEVVVPSLAEISVNAVA